MKNYTVSIVIETTIDPTIQANSEKALATRLQQNGKKLGVSQGAMVVHRNLAALETSPNLAAALLVADGDRQPADPTLNLGSVTAVPGRGKGVAQDWPILAHAPAPLTPTMGARTISVCDLGDAVCDYDPDAEDDMNPAAVAVHTSYARNASAMDAWTAPLFRLVQSRPVAVPDANPMQVAAGS